MRKPKERVTMYQVKYMAVTINGDVEVRTHWESRIEDLNPKFLRENEAVIIERSYDKYFPTRAEVKEGARTGNRFWLNNNEVQREIPVEAV